MGGRENSQVRNIVALCSIIVTEEKRGTIDGEIVKISTSIIVDNKSFERGLNLSGS